MAAKRGERKLQILQALAEMLENPAGEKITTAALAARLDCSEAALYRHFASKAQMFEGLIEFIEASLFGVINQITADEPDGLRQCEAILGMMLRFAQRNRGMTRVLIGEALVHENDRLQARMNQLGDRLEATLKQCLRIAATQDAVAPATDFAALANLMQSFVNGQWQAYAKSGFSRDPAARWTQQWPLIRAACTAAPVMSQ